MHDVADPPLQINASPEVDVRALAGPPQISHPPATVRRRSVVLAIVMAMVVAGLAGGGVWWHHQVAADPGLEFYGGPNVYRDEASTDLSGIERNDNLLGDEMDVAFVRNGRFYVHFGLYNGGAHDVRIVGAPPGRYYYWGFDRMSLSTDRDDGFAGTASHYGPFRPFTLHRGETRDVRLEYRIADCDPAGLQPGFSSVRSLPLRYHTLGITRRADVPFRDAVVALRTIGDCSNPISD